MLSLFKIFKKNKTSSTNTSHNPTLEPNIYDPNLIPNLLDDHKILLDMINKIQQVAGTKKWTILAKELDSFKEKTYAHLLIENNNLYTYLKRSLRNDPTNLDLMIHLQKEMTSITPTIISFFRIYSDIATNTQKQGSFNKDFASICSALEKRINCEENSLYTMYHP